MSLKFISFYGAVVILTSLFFQFLPEPHMLSWEELLLSKFLNQSPSLLCLGYLWFHQKRIKRVYIFSLLIAFLFLNVFSEVYYYLVSPEYLAPVNILNNIAIYVVLLMLFIAQRTQIKAHVFNTRNTTYAILTTVLFLIGFGISVPQAYEKYLAESALFFYIILAAMLITSLTVCMSFFVDKTRSRNWYKLVAGTILIALVDIYVYLSIFVFDASPFFIYTIGKLIFSIGILLIVDRSIGKCLYNKPALGISNGLIKSV
ncbi:hypothetical protein [Emticicia soli]|uniref:Uncharacterized protein n=1 Tax=Emticicia soli TaxID=2027878 RepID=A0ABW5J9D2_9BACT